MVLPFSTPARIPAACKREVNFCAFSRLLNAPACTLIDPESRRNGRLERVTVVRAISVRVVLACEVLVIADVVLEDGLLACGYGVSEIFSVLRVGMAPGTLLERSEERRVGKEC